jgi:hypothetical protein
VEEEDSDEEWCGIAGMAGRGAAGVGLGGGGARGQFSDDEDDKASYVPSVAQSQRLMQTQFLDDAFERLAMDYDDDDIGDLENDPKAKGHADIHNYDKIMDKVCAPHNRVNSL